MSRFRFHGLLIHRVKQNTRKHMSPPGSLCLWDRVEGKSQLVSPKPSRSTLLELAAPPPLSLANLHGVTSLVVNPLWTLLVPLFFTQAQIHSSPGFHIIHSSANSCRYEGLFPAKEILPLTAFQILHYKTLLRAVLSKYTKFIPPLCTNTGGSSSPNFRGTNLNFIKKVVQCHVNKKLCVR